MDEKAIGCLAGIVGADRVVTALEQKQAYLYDEMEPAVRPQANEKSVVVKPENTGQISRIMAFANENGIPVVVRGGGTGLCGAAIPTSESIVISMERMKRIVEIDEKNMMATLEAGVTLRELLEALEQHTGLAFPVHPGDEGAQVGGMAATNAGGARAVRHGIMRNHIKGIEAVLPNGDILSLGGKLLKDNAGYSLMHLIIGSEGTLAVITRVTLRVYPEEKYTATLAIAFESLDDASNAVLDIIKCGVSPLAVEYQDKNLNRKTAGCLGLHWPLSKGSADLMIILSEKSEALLYKACETVDAICDRHNALEAVFAGTKKEQAELLAIRSGSYEVVKDIIVHSFDMAVPAGHMPEFLKDLQLLAVRYGTVTNITAHIADGNTHNDIIMKDGRIPEYAEELKLKMYQACFKYGGTITGEHGIGKLRVADLKLQKPAAELELMRQIKRVFDPKGIMNPGTVVEA